MMIVRMLRGRACLLAVLTLCLGPAAWAAERQDFDDPRIVAWAAAFVEGKPDQVLAQVDADLRSSSPHPYAPQIWAVLHNRRNTLKSALDQADAVLKERLGTTPAMLLAERAGDKHGMLTLMRTPSTTQRLDYFGYRMAAWAAEGVADHQAYQDAVLGMAGFPITYSTIQYLLDDLRDLSLRRRFQALLDERADADTGWAAAARSMRERLTYAPDLLARANAFLAEHPRDYIAWRAKGNALRDMQRFAEAAEAYESAYRSFPFIPLDWNGWRDEIHALVMAGRLAAAQGVAQRIAVAHSDSATAPANAAVLLVDALINAGEKGEARRQLEASLTQWPDVPPLHDLAAKLELDSKRAAEAVPHARTAVALAPTSGDYKERLVRALTASGETDAALQIAADALRASPSPDWYYVLAGAHEKREDWDRYHETYRAAVQRFPASSWMRDNFAYSYAKLGRHTEAFQVLQSWLATHSADSWEATRFREYAYASMGADAARSATEALRASQGWNQALWSDAARQLGTTNQDAVARLWAQARAITPQAAWAWEGSLSFSIENRRWAEAEHIFADLSRVAAGRHGLTEVATERRAFFLVEAAKNKVRPSADLRSFLPELDRHRDIMFARDYWWLKWKLSGDAFGQAEGLINYLRCMPDAEGFYNWLSEIGTDEARRFQPLSLWRYLDRDPLNPKKLEEFAHRHGWWLGDAVGALWAYERLRQVNPQYFEEKRIASKIVNAKALLGDHSGEAASYLQSSSISSSDRYIGWFDKARRNAEADLGQNSVSFDPETVRAEIHLANGEKVVLENDLKAARPTLIQKGSAWVRATYNEDGNLNSVRGSGGQNIALEYEGQLIRSMTSSDGRAIRFEYNALDKPVVIEVKGVGTIVVTYADDGEIENVRSDGGTGIALQVTTQFNQLLELIRVFQRSGIDAELPELPVSDPDVDVLRARLDDSETRADRDAAALALAEHLIDRTGDRVSYAEEAATLLHGILEPEDETEPAVPETAVRALVQWHRSVSGRRGVRQEEWGRWVRYRERLQASLRGVALPEAAAAALRTLEQTPLTLLPAARWLPRHDLSAQAQWRRFDRAALSLADGQSAGAVLVRGNGDIVMASDGGLRVYRRGYWESFAFDAVARRFAPATPGGGKGVAVLSLAEGTAGQLWIGTAIGLFRLDGDYAGSAADVAPGFVVEQLVPFGSGVLAGGAGGARVFGDGTVPALPAAVAQTPVRSLHTLAPAAAPEARSLDALDEAVFQTPTLSVKAEGKAQVAILGGGGRRQRLIPRALDKGVGFVAGRYAAIPDPRTLELWPVSGADGPVTIRLASPLFDVNGTDDGFVVTVESDGRTILHASDGKKAWTIADNDAGRGSLGLTGDHRWLVRAGDMIRVVDLKNPDSVRRIVPANGESFLGLTDDGKRLLFAAGQPFEIDPADGGRRSVAHVHPTLLANGRGLYVIDRAGVRDLGLAGVDEVVWSRDEERLFLRRGDAVLTAAWNGVGAVGEALPLDPAQLAGLGQVLGLTEVALDIGTLPALITAKGLALWRHQHFEVLRPSLGDGDGRIVAVASRPDVTANLWLLRERGLLNAGWGHFKADADGRVHDLLALPDGHGVAIARGDQIELAPADQPLARTSLYTGKTTHLALDRSGRLIANDGFSIIRFDDLGSEPNVLFQAESSGRSDQTDSSFRRVSSLLVAADGAVWVSAGPSVFRWLDGRTEEFSMFVAPEAFPVKSDAISRVVETVDKRIWVVASYEAHRAIGADSLVGGLFEFTGTGFRRLDLTSDSIPWFITGYTPIDSRRAIVGTTQGFAEHRSDRYASVQDLGNPSYRALQDRQPALYLGRRGARLPDGTWLFGTAGGIVGLHGDTWYRPGRLNGLLPDPATHPFGGITVHAVAATADGHVYAGTDRGLLIYKTPGWFDLMVGDDRAMAAFDAAARERLAATAKALADADDPPGVKAALRLRQEVTELRSALMPGRLEWLRPALVSGSGETPWPVVQPSATPSGRDASRLRARADGQDVAYHRALKALEQQNPPRYQELALPDVAAERWWSGLEPGLAERAALLEYVVTADSVHIRLHVGGKATVKRVAVPREDLRRSVDEAAAALAGAGAPPVNALASLYDVLLRPVEDALQGRDLLLVVPDPAFAAVPMATLVAATAPRPIYAVERFRFAYLPSLHVAAVMPNAAATANGVLAVGDTTAADARARAEVLSVIDVTGRKHRPLLGADARPAAVMAAVAQGSWLHLALPGQLDGSRPDQLGALFGATGDGDALSAVALGARINGLVLSRPPAPAGDGATRDALLRALLRGGSGRLVLPLWQPPGAAETGLLGGFYTSLLGEGRGPADALAAVQRRMIASPRDDLRNPAAWGSFIAMGHP